MVQRGTQRLAYCSGVGDWPDRARLTHALHRLAAAASDGLKHVPAQRWLIAESPSCDTEHLGALGYLAFLDDAELFYNVCFRVSCAEVAVMDPQQRLLLERGYGSLHGAGERRASLQVSDTAVFLGITHADFGVSLTTSNKSVNAATEALISIASGRLSFVLGMQGPCTSVDTASSSALVATHTAGHALRASECKLSVAAAVNLVLTPQVSITYACAGMLSAEGRCKKFDTSANGYVRGEGVGALVLALETTPIPPRTIPRSNVILVSASGVQHDGRSASLTAPSGSAQARLLQFVAAAHSMPLQLASFESH